MRASNADRVNNGNRPIIRAKGQQESPIGYAMSYREVLISLSLASCEGQSATAFDAQAARETLLPASGCGTNRT